MAKRKVRRKMIIESFYINDGTLRQRKDGRYELILKYKDRYGMVVRKSFYGWSEDECFDKADLFEDTYGNENGLKTSSITIPQLVKEKYEKDLAMNFVAGSGYSRNLSNLMIIQNHVIGQIPIQTVNRKHLDRFFVDVTKYSNSVIEKLFQQLKTAFNIAQSRGIIRDNLLLSPDIRPPKSARPDKKVRALTEEEQKKLVEHLESHKPPYGRNDYRLQLLIELYSGMRMGEINALRSGDIDFKAGLIHVHATISRDINYRSFLNDTTKTEAGIRDVPISETLKPILEEALKKQIPNPDNLIFYDNYKHTVITTMQVNDYYRRVCHTIGIEHNGQHALRHTFATRCIEAGIQPVVLKTWLGHTDIHVTLDTYADVFDKLNNSSLSMLDEHMKQVNGMRK